MASVGRENGRERSPDLSTRDGRTSRAGKAYLIGAGPGDPRLLTLRAVDALREAELVLVDDLVNPDVLDHVVSARVVRVGKRCGRHSMSQAQTNCTLVDAVRGGAVVARLKGGDPFVFGRGGEEALALARAGLRFEIIPGVTAALGAAAYAGIPLTLRGVASSVAFVAGHAEDERPIRAAEVAADTLAVFMCQRTITRLARELLVAGRAGETPVAIVRGATCERQEVHVGTLAELASLRDDWFATLDPSLPGLAIVGEVVRLATALAWHTRPEPLARLNTFEPSCVAAGGTR